MGLKEKKKKVKKKHDGERVDRWKTDAPRCEERPKYIRGTGVTVVAVQIGGFADLTVFTKWRRRG
ncbi:MAG: hypothetical protein Q8P67_10710, partial [archaeon]|nr:hypothetical protein [archaeon]